MADAMQYEFLLRRAFNVKYKSEDPAGLASADIYNCVRNENDIRRVRIALQYAVIAFRYKYSNNKNINDPEDSDRINELLKELDHIETISQLHEAVDKVLELEKVYEALPDNYPDDDSSNTDSVE